MEKLQQEASDVLIQNLYKIKAALWPLLFFFNPIKLH